MAGKKMLSEK